MPAKTRDPIAACAAAVQNVNAIAARENDFGSASSGFISITQIHVRSVRGRRCSSAAASVGLSLANDREREREGTQTDRKMQIQQQ